MKQRVLLKGKDGIDLLHRISTIDLRQPKLNEKMMGLILNPQGKIRSQFFITVLNRDEAEIEFADNFLVVLEEITFGEHYEIESLAPLNSVAVSEHARILSLTPKLGNEFKSNAETNPLEVNLRSAIHDQKGCYPGQEVIEKVISLGSPARKLCLVEGNLDSVICPATLTNSSGLEAGLLTSYDQGLGLAVIKRPYLKENEPLFLGTQKLTLKRISSS